jgi:hypothetical protein
MNSPPIFIVGAPRSGTTLLRNLLNRHPRLAICGETHFNRLIYRRRKVFGDIGNLDNRRRLIKEYMATDRILRSEIKLAGLEDRLLRDATSYPAFFASLMEHFAESEGKPRCGEKTPQHALLTEQLSEWYPGAPIIHIVRDPREVVASLQRVGWASDSVYTNTRTWIRNNTAARKSSHRPEYLVVSYQDLVTGPEKELRRICAHVREDFSPSMLVVETRVIDERTGWGRAKTAVTPERMGKWQQQLTQKQVALIEWTAGSHLASFGYSASAIPPPTMPTIAGGLSFAAIDAFWRRMLYLPAVFYHLLRPTKISKEEFWIFRRVRKAQRAQRGPDTIRQAQ